MSFTQVVFCVTSIMVFVSVMNFDFFEASYSASKDFYCKMGVIPFILIGFITQQWWLSLPYLAFIELKYLSSHSINQNKSSAFISVFLIILYIYSTARFFI